METLQPKKEYVPSVPYIIFLREAIKGGYKPTLEEKLLLKKFSVKAVKSNPKSIVGQMRKNMEAKVEAH